MRSNTRLMWRWLKVGSLLAAGAAGGCGWTARDEFYRSRGVTMHAQAGDGSELSWDARSEPGYRNSGSEVASRWEREK